MPSIKARRVAALSKRIKKSTAALRSFERVESELLSMSKSEYTVRFQTLMTANAEILNATRLSLSVDQKELDSLTM